MYISAYKLYKKAKVMKCRKFDNYLNKLQITFTIVIEHDYTFLNT